MLLCSAVVRRIVSAGPEGGCEGIHRLLLPDIRSETQARDLFVVLLSIRPSGLMMWGAFSGTVSDVGVSCVSYLAPDSNRNNLASLYTEGSMLTFEGEEFKGVKV